MRNLVYVLTFLLSPSLLAQTADTMTPVDQAVEDLDTLARSLRKMERGIRSDGETTSLFRVQALTTDQGGGSRVMTPGSTPTYYRTGPGFHARVKRLDYLVRVGDRDLGVNIQPRLDGEFIEMISADTVFELTPIRSYPVRQTEVSRQQPATPHPLDPSVTPHALDQRIDARLDLRIDGRVDARWPAASSRHTRPVPE